MHAIRTTAFSGYRIEEKATGVWIRLFHSLQETVFELPQPLDAGTSTRLRLALKDYKSTSSYAPLSAEVA